MNAKDLLGKKIIDKKVRDIAKLAEIDVNGKTSKISNIYGSVGNPLNKKYYDIPASSILAVGDYIQVAETKEELDKKLLDKIPETENLKINNLINKTVINSEGYIVGKVQNVDIDLESFSMKDITISTTTTLSFSNENVVFSQDDISSIGDFIILNKTLVEEKEEKAEESKDSVEVEIE